MLDAIDLVNTKLKLQIRPGSKKEGFELTPTGDLKLKVSAPPSDGQANERVIEILSKALRIPKTTIQIAQGSASKSKTIEIIDFKHNHLTRYLLERMPLKD